jgi:hypothetical protein
MLRRHVEHVAGHFGVWALESQHLDRQPERKYREHEAEKPADHLGALPSRRPTYAPPSPALIACDGAGRGWRGRLPSR